MMRGASRSRENFEGGIALEVLKEGKLGRMQFEAVMWGLRCSQKAARGGEEGCDA